MRHAVHSWVVAFVALSACFNANVALALDPVISRGDDGTVTVEFDNNRIAEVSDALSKAFMVRVCAEDFGTVNAANKAIPVQTPEAGGPLREGAEPVISGVYTSASADETLADITNASPYTWLKTNEGYVIYPRKGSLLMEKITVAVPASSLFDVLCGILASRDSKTSKEEPIRFAHLGLGGPVPEATDVHTLETLTFVATPLMEALCRAVEAADPKAGEGMFIWQLCSGAAREWRNIDARWINFRNPFKK